LISVKKTSKIKKLLFYLYSEEKEEKFMDNQDSRGFLTGLLLGAAVGLAIGFLYAPQPGSETRQMLKEKAEVAKVKAAELAHKAKEAAAEAKKKAQERLKFSKQEEA
jgi:gas vesicle protein